MLPARIQQLFVLKEDHARIELRDVQPEQKAKDFMEVTGQRFRENPNLKAREQLMNVDCWWNNY